MFPLISLQWHLSMILPVATPWPLPPGWKWLWLCSTLSSSSVSPRGLPGNPHPPLAHSPRLPPKTRSQGNSQMVWSGWLTKSWPVDWSECHIWYIYTYLNPLLFKIIVYVESFKRFVFVFVSVFVLSLYLSLSWYRAISGCHIQRGYRVGRKKGEGWEGEDFFLSL